MELGAQLFTLRDYCRNLEDFAVTLKRVADMGYKTVQVSGTCAFEGQWLAEELKKNDLRCVLTHTAIEKIRDNTEVVIGEHQTFGCRYVGIGCAPNCFANGEPDMKALCDTIDAAARKLADKDMLLMYHNHACEFQRGIDGRKYYDRLIEDYAPSILGFTVDTFWLQLGGMNVTETIRRLKGRVPCIHLKDLDVQVNKPVTAPVGHGNLDFDAILAACDDAGAKYLLVEQDDCYEDPFVCMKKSLDFLHSRGLR